MRLLNDGTGPGTTKPPEHIYTDKKRCREKAVYHKSKMDYFVAFTTHREYQNIKTLYR